MCKCTWAFLSIKKKMYPHLVFSPFWREYFSSGPGEKTPRSHHFFSLSSLQSNTHKNVFFPIFSHFFFIHFKIHPTKHTLIGVFSFSHHFHFHPYFLILPHLVPKIKRRSHFCPYRHLTNGNSLRGKRSALLAH